MAGRGEVTGHRRAHHPETDEGDGAHAVQSCRSRMHVLSVSPIGGGRTAAGCWPDAAMATARPPPRPTRRPTSRTRRSPGPPPLPVFDAADGQQCAAAGHDHERDRACPAGRSAPAAARSGRPATATARNSPPTRSAATSATSDHGEGDQRRAIGQRAGRTRPVEHPVARPDEDAVTGDRPPDGHRRRRARPRRRPLGDRRPTATTWLASNTPASHPPTHAADDAHHQRRQGDRPKRAGRRSTNDTTRIAAQPD